MELASHDSCQHNPLTLTARSKSRARALGWASRAVGTIDAIARRVPRPPLGVSRKLDESRRIGRIERASAAEQGPRDTVEGTMETRHTDTCGRVFKRYDPTCARCRELAAGAAPRQGWRTTRQTDANRRAEIAAHDCAKSGCGPVCTAFDW